MAIGDYIDIGGRLFKEVDPADGPSNENPGATYVPVMDNDALTAMDLAIGSTDDAAWNGTDPNATVISLLKKIALNTTP